MSVVTRFDQAITDLDKALAEKERLVVIKADLEQAEKQLQQYEQLLKDGKMLPVNADVTKAKEALDKLTTYAKEHSELELRVSSEKATAAITNVDNQLRALDNIQTESKHQVSSNTDAVRSEIQSLNGQDTSSTHTIYVTRVETNATGGLVGNGLAGNPVAAFASGGAVTPAGSTFPKMASGTVPGSGNQDSVPRTLDAGSFVLRKAAVRKYGNLLAQLRGLRFVDAFPSVLTPVIGITIQPISLDACLVVTVVRVCRHFGLPPLFPSLFLTVRCGAKGVVFDSWVWLEGLAAAGANFGAHQVSPYENSYGNC